MSDYCELYLIQCGAGGPIKIGRALSTERRVKALQTGSPHPLRVINLYTLHFGDAVEAEGRLHGELEDARLCGEWFDVSEKFITEYVPTFFRSVGLSFIEGEICEEHGWVL